MQALMQINHKAWNKLGWIFKLLVLATCLWFISMALGEKWATGFNSFVIPWVAVAIITAMVFLNWGLEVWRWKISLEHIGKSSWSLASRQVFAGQALNWILPFTGGDLASKLFHKNSKWETGQIIYLNRGLMLGITILFGAFGLYMYSSTFFFSYVSILVTVLVAIVGLGIFWSRFSVSIDNQKALLKLLIPISLLRYAVFTLQFFIILKAFNPELGGMVILGGIGWIFLFRSVIPSLFGNLGVREASAMIFFDSMVMSVELILLPCLLIWTINSVLPSLFGLYHLIRFPIKIAS